MPCFKGLAVSIHTPDGPLAEYSIQKQSRASRISTYIAVPPAKVPDDSLTGKPEQSAFSVSITLLTPGLKVPYSAPKPTPDDPYPVGRTVGGLPGSFGERGRYEPIIAPYMPRTTSPNETLAAYIYFDGRAKEEVATLLRRGEETWVNSRWVSVPQSEGGGLAEREFLFREVGLERWLNGLDLVGKDKAARLEKRHQKLEKKRRLKKELLSDDEEEQKPKLDRNGVLRYGGDQGSPVESVMDEEGLLSSDDDSDDDIPQTEAAGQIKVALFRVLASGEIKRGEYEPKFDAHDDEGEENGGGADADVDHTTSFAKPKTLDPKSISTQTVTGLDAPDSPFAVFTFFYRGEKQLQKMGILERPDSKHPTPVAAKRKSMGTDFSKLGPLNSFGTKGFTGYRETASPKRKGRKDDEDAMDSDADDDEAGAKKDNDEVDEQDSNDKLLSPDDARKQGELTEGVQRIKLKRVHSAEPLTETRKSPHMKTSDSPTSGTPRSGDSTAANAGTPSRQTSPSVSTSNPAATITSPFKKQRASMSGIDTSFLAPLDTNNPKSAPALADATSTDLPPASSRAAPLSAPPQGPNIDEDEEL